MDGVFNIFKEKGFTSHDVVAVVRKTIGQKRVGHTGTLDPEAEGVLPICVGQATKLADYLMADKKCYQAELTLGVTTTTEDQSGEVIEEKPVNFDPEKIKEAVSKFIGVYDQVPPMYSAIKIEGKKLYELARKGEVIERKSRRIEIYDIQITKFLPPNKIEMIVDCQKGTYIRTLCSDIGKALGCGGHMSKLMRTASGQFQVKDSITLSELKELSLQGKLQDAVISMEKAMASYKKIKILEKGKKLLYNGAKLDESYFEKTENSLIPDEFVMVFDEDENLVGIYKALEEENKVKIKPVRLLLEQC